MGAGSGTTTTPLRVAPLWMSHITAFEVLVSAILWFVSGHTANSYSKFLQDSIEEYTFRTSFFDLALLGIFLRFIPFYVVPGLVFRSRIPWGILGLGMTELASLSVIIAKFIAITPAALTSTNPSPHLLGLTPVYVFIGIVLSGIICLVNCIALILHRRSLVRHSAYARLRYGVNNDDHQAALIGGALASAPDISATRRGQSNLLRVMTLARPEATLLTLGTLALFGSSFSQLAMPYIFGKVIDAISHTQEDPHAKLNRAVIMLLIIFAIGAFCTFIRSWLFTLAGQRLVARLRCQVFNSMVIQETAFFDQNRTGELTNRLSSDTQVIQNAATVNISQTLRYIVQILGSLAILLALSWRLTLVMFSSVPIVGIGAVQYGKFIKKFRKKFQDELAKASTTAEEVLSNIRTVRSFANEEQSQNSYATDIDGSYQIGAKMAFATGTFAGGVGLFAQSAIGLVLWYGGTLVLSGRLTPGVLTSFLLYTMTVAMAFAFLTSLYGDFMSAVGASKRLFELIDRTPDIPWTGGDVVPHFTGNISLQKIHFSYPSRPDSAVLNDISLDLRPGTVTALVGPSGGGKSTIVALIERFYEPTSGSITFDGHKLKTLDPTWVRTQIGFVSQEPVLFAGTIAENIGYGKQGATEEELIAAAKQANAHEFISEFKEGYDTAVGERGVRLSGGQKQRIAIARALVLDPCILLLDEATSALDAESEYLVQQAIDRAMQDRTVLVIAHRLSTVRSADQVAVLKDGAVSELGTHDELIAHPDGLYRQLVRRQLQADQQQEGEDNSQGDA